MKIMIMTDMEGCAGILNHDDWVLPTGRYYEKGKRFLTAEVNAAVEGFFQAGATEIVVVDGHGCGGIDPELLDERAVLRNGIVAPLFPWGLDRSFDALAFVGQHAKSGTPYSHISHTGWFHVLDLTLNGFSIGEYGELALCAMEQGVPTIFASGEKALSEEAGTITPGAVLVSVKEGLLPDGLDDLDCEAYRKAKLAALHLSPSKARSLITEGSFRAMMKLKANPAKFKYPKISTPYAMTVKFRRIGDAPPRQKTLENAKTVADLFNSID